MFTLAGARPTLPTALTVPKVANEVCASVMLIWLPVTDVAPLIVPFKVILPCDPALNTLVEPVEVNPAVPVFEIFALLVVTEITPVLVSLSATVPNNFAAVVSIVIDEGAKPVVVVTEPLAVIVKLPNIVSAPSETFPAADPVDPIVLIDRLPAVDATPIATGPLLAVIDKLPPVNAPADV